MNIENFDLEIIKPHIRTAAFYMLENVGSNTDSIQLFNNTVDGEVEFNNFTPLRMNNNKVLIVIHKINSVFADYSLIARDGFSEEIINTQTFERLYKYYDTSAEANVGFFIFENSVPVPQDGYGWRCDKNRFGPQFFMKNDVEYDPLFADLSEIIIYEPVLSLSGTAHIIYVHGTKDDENKDFHLEQYELPRASLTLFELLKLITEWAECASDPWNNQESISIKAKQFIEGLNFSSEFIEEIKTNQVDMQVFKYLKGDANARLRSPNTEPMNNIIESEIKKKVSHLCLTHILSIFSGSVDNIDQIKEYELSSVQEKQNALINELNLNIDKFYFEDTPAIIESMRAKQGGVKNVSRDLYISLVGKHKEILDSIIG